MSDRPADERPRSEPWWASPSVPSRPPEGERDEAKAAPDPASPGLDLFDRREPILLTVSARLEPLEEMVRRVASEIDATREALSAMAVETRDALKTLSGDVETVRAEGADGARSLGDDLSSVSDRVEAAEQRLEGGLRQARQEIAASVAGAAERADLRLNAATESLASALARLGSSVGGAARADRLDAVGEGLEAAVGHVRVAVDAVRTELGAVVDSSRAEVLDAVRGSRAELDAQLGEAKEELSGAVAATSADLEASAATARREAGEALERVRAELSDSLTALRDGLSEATSSLGQAVRRAEGTLRSVVEDARKNLEEAGAADAARIRAHHEETTERSTKALAKAMKTLEEGLGRVERLGTVVEAMAERRGFRELVDSEEALRQEQAEYVGTLSETGTRVEATVDRLDARLGQLEQRIGEAVDRAGHLETVPGRAGEEVSASIERLRRDLAETLGSRFGEQVAAALDRLRAELEGGLPVKDTLRELRALAAAQSEVARTQREVDEAATGLRAEVQALRDRIEGWGQARSAPHLASDLEALGERVERLERLLDGELADRVSSEVTARVMNALDQRAEQRRGLFRR